MFWPLFRSNDACTMIGKRAPGLLQRAIGGREDALDDQQVLLRFDQQHIGAAGEQPADLLGVAVQHRVPGRYGRA